MKQKQKLEIKKKKKLTALQLKQKFYDTILSDEYLKPVLVIHWKERKF